MSTFRSLLTGLFERLRPQKQLTYEVIERKPMKLIRRSDSEMGDITLSVPPEVGTIEALGWSGEVAMAASVGTNVQVGPLTPTGERTLYYRLRMPDGSVKVESVDLYITDQDFGTT